MASGAHTRSLCKDVDSEQAVLERIPLLFDKTHHKANGNIANSWLASWDIIGFLINLRDHFGYKLMFLLFVSQHINKGFFGVVLDQVEPYIYRDFGVPAPRMQVYLCLTTLPWAMKPMIGLVSDAFPVFGYNKAPYVIFASLLGVTALFIVGLTPSSAMVAAGVAACLFFAQLQCSAVDLLSEAKYAQHLRSSPTHGTDLLSFVWVGLRVSHLLGVLIAGPLIAEAGSKTTLLFCAVPAAAIFMPALFGYFEEQPQGAAEREKTVQRFLGQSEVCFLCVLMFIGTCTLSFVALTTRNPLINCVAALSVAVVMLVSFSLTLSPAIAKFAAFSLIQRSLFLNISGATFYFYTDSREAYPDGPHFTPYFYNSTIGVLGSLCALLGIVLYRRYASDWKTRKIIVTTSLVIAGLALLDCLLFLRWNKKLGISDKAFVLGNTVLEHAVHEFMWMPCVAITAYLCPRGMEATIYALVCGAYNLGSCVSKSCGALLLHRLGCSPVGAPNEGAQFDNLWIASAIHTILPLFAVLAMYQLIPDCRQNELIVGDQDKAATSGSLWRRWRGEIPAPEVNEGGGSSRHGGQ